jgi:hypothetical protein
MFSMSYSPGALLLSVVTGGVGVALLMYGRKAQRMPQLVAGVAFLIYPYFVSSTLMTFVIGAVVTAALWAALWMGW